MSNHPSRRSGYAKHESAACRIVDFVETRRRIGWSLNRLHVEQRTGERAVAIIGWRASDLGIETDDTIELPRGVCAMSWSAPDDDRIELVDPWTDDTMRALCRALGIISFDRHDGPDRVAWLVDVRSGSGRRNR